MDTCWTQNSRWGGENKFRSLVPPLVRYWGKCPPNLGGGPKDICRTTAAKLAEVVLFGGQMSSKFIVQMSSYHCRHRQNWTNVLQTLPPMANVLQPFIVQMSSYHCRHCQNWADVLQTLPPKQMSSNYYQPLLPELVKCKIWSPMMALPIFSHYYLGRPVH